jgi:hypothetical protein
LEADADQAGFLGQFQKRVEQDLQAFGFNTLGCHSPTRYYSQSIDVVARHVDLLFYQFYGHYGIQHPVIEDWSRRTGKPLLNGDSSFSVPDAMMPCPLGPHCADQAERAEVSLSFARRAFGRPDFVGWHWCGWMDGWKTIPGKELRQHSGVQDPFGRRYAPMVAALSSIAKEMYHVADPT